VELVLYIVVSLTTSDPMSSGTILYLNMFRYMGDILVLVSIIRIHMRDDISLFDILFKPCVLRSNAKQFYSLRTIWILYVHPCTSIIIFFIIPITHSFG
jgi:hypothetical protein